MKRKKNVPYKCGLYFRQYGLNLETHATFEINILFK